MPIAYFSKAKLALLAVSVLAPQLGRLRDLFVGKAAPAGPMTAEQFAALHADVIASGKDDPKANTSLGIARVITFVGRNDYSVSLVVPPGQADLVRTVYEPALDAIRRYSSPGPVNGWRCKHGFSVPQVCPGDDRCPVEAAKPAPPDPFLPVRYIAMKQWFETTDGKWVCKAPRGNKAPVKFDPRNLMFISTDGTHTAAVAAASANEERYRLREGSIAKPKVADEAVRAVRAHGPLGPTVAEALGPKLDYVGKSGLDIAIDLPRPGTSDYSI